MTIIYKEHQKQTIQAKNFKTNRQCNRHENDVVAAEVANEIKHAFQLFDGIRKKLSWKWDDIFSQLKNTTQGWQDCGEVFKLPQ